MGVQAGGGRRYRSSDRLGDTQRHPGAEPSHRCAVRRRRGGATGARGRAHRPSRLGGLPGRNGDGSTRLRPRARRVTVARFRGRLPHHVREGLGPCPARDGPGRWRQPDLVGQGERPQGAPGRPAAGHAQRRGRGRRGRRPVHRRGRDGPGRDGRGRLVPPGGETRGGRRTARGVPGGGGFGHRPIQFTTAAGGGTANDGTSGHSTARGPAPRFTR